MKREAVEDTAYGVGFFEGILKVIPEDVVFESFQEITGNGWITPDSTIPEIKNIVVTESIRRNMDVFELVMKMRDVPYRDAYQFVKTGDFKQLEIKHDPKEPFEYKLKPFEDATFSEARAYLKNERQLSDETIDFFIDKEVLVQATRRTNVSDVTELAGDYYYDPVVAFKVLDRDKTVIGTSLVGIGDKAVYSLPGTPVRRKQIGWNSDGLGGLNVSIGTPNRIVIVEAPIDLMSYYELHKDNLQDVTLVALDGSGTKMSTVKRYVLDLVSNGHWSQSLDRSGLATAFDMVLENTDLFKKRDNLITVAVDNDEAGKKNGQYVRRTRYTSSCRFTPSS